MSVGGDDLRGQGTDLVVAAPFFVVGAERSGTTLLRLMLDHHPEIACHYEFEFSVDLVSDDGQMPAIDDVRRSFERPWLRDALSAPGCDGVFPSCRTHEEFVNWKLCRWRDASGKQDVGATVHRHFDRLTHIWPEARFVHIVRDGRDVARSRVQMMWHGNVWTAIDVWLEAEASWEVLRGRVQASRRMEICYEDLVRSPRQTLSEVCAFLGRSFSDRMFDYSQQTTYDRPDAANVQRWRDRSTPRDIQLMECKAGEILAARGYELSGLDRIDVSAAEDAALRSACLAERRRMRVERYGLPMLLARKAAAAMRIGPLRRWIDERMHAVDLSYIK